MPATNSVPEVEVKVPLEMVISPATAKSVVPPPTVPAIVRLLNVRVPELAIDPPVKVIVPDVGAKVFVASTVRGPATENEAVG